MYSNRNDKCHFGDSGFDTAIIDLNGEYGMTQHSMAIEINDLQEGENILKALQSEKFNNLKIVVYFHNMLLTGIYLKHSKEIGGKNM